MELCEWWCVFGPGLCHACRVFEGRVVLVSRAPVCPAYLDLDQFRFPCCVVPSIPDLCLRHEAFHFRECRVSY